MSCSRFISKWSLAAVVGLYLTQPASAVTLSTSVQTVILNPFLDVEFNYGSFLKFNTKLGTLKNVTLKINSLTIGGSFTFSQGTAGTCTLYAFYTDTVFLAGSSYNNTNHNGLIVDNDVLPGGTVLTVLNQVMPKTITRRNSATFNFNSNQNLLLAPKVVLNLSAQKDLNYYTGTGISFAPAFTSITQFLISGSNGGNPTRDYSKLTATIGLSLYYDYIPATIPEPSYYGLGLSLAALGVCLGRRYAQREDQPLGG
jgi:hypothetical protein